jgi:hypothetical protein
VAAAASAFGVQPSAWEPDARRTPTEVANLLKDAGFEEDDAGRILLDDFSLGGVTMAFDPNLKTPLEGFRHCMHRIQACRATTGALDACVAAMPRCTSSSPWLDDAAGFDCCPQACLLEYFEDRSVHPPGEAAVRLAQSTCYPGLRTYLEGL